MTKARPKQCATCIFGPPGSRVELTPERWGDIIEYILRGVPHLCHSPGPTGKAHELACRGARNYVLTFWARIGLITEPTDEALESAMRACGIDPEKGAR